MNLKEKFIWNFTISICALALLWNLWNLYQLNSNANELYDKFLSESNNVGTDKLLQNKVSELESNYKYRDNLKFSISSDPADLNRVVSIDGNSGSKKRGSLYANSIVSRGNGRFTAIMNFKDKTYNVDKGDSIAGGVIIDINSTEVVFKKNDKEFRYNLSITNTLE